MEEKRNLGANELVNAFIEELFQWSELPPRIRAAWRYYIAAVLNYPAD
ncbi:hypothetical protein [Acidobacterium sp. S8]|nr:hypothetical protein [Acidobacterium sp. S8]